MLRSSVDPRDEARASECVVVQEMTADLLRCTADLTAHEAIAKRVLMCRVDAWVRICEREPPTTTSTFLAAAYTSRTVREFLLTSEWHADWMASEQSISEHVTALDAVANAVDERLASKCPQLLRSSMLSPRTFNFQQRFQVGFNEMLLGTFPCAIDSGMGLRQGVLHVSTHHVCFEAALFAASYTQIPLASILSIEGCRDPFFHLFPNSIKLGLDKGGSITFAFKP